MLTGHIEFWFLQISKISCILLFLYVNFRKTVLIRFGFFTVSVYLGQRKWCTNLGGLFRGLFFGSNITTAHRLKLVRTVLETWNSVRKYTDIFSFKKNSGSLNFAFFFFAKVNHFSSKIVPLHKAIVYY